MKRSSFFFVVFFLSFLKKGWHHSSGLRSIRLNNVLKPASPWDCTHIRERWVFFFSDIDSISLVLGGAGPGSRVGMKLCLVRQLSVAPCTVGTVMDLTARLEVAQLQFTIYNYLFILKKDI